MKIARAKMAGSFFGARPASLIATMRWTVRSPSWVTQRRTAWAFSMVKCCSST
jgi:hypothetical protein